MRFLIALILMFSIASAKTPIGFKTWDMGDGRHLHQFGGAVQNYPDGDQWKPIENNWITIDTLHTNRRGLLKTDVNNSGQIFTSVILGADTVTIAQRLISLKWFRSADSAWFNIDNSPNWGTPSVADNQIKWTGVFPAVDVAIDKYEGQVDYTLHFKPAFLDSAVALYNQRADSSDIYLANVIAVELVGADSTLGTMNKKLLRKFGGYSLNMNESFLEYPGSDTLQRVRVKQRYVVQGGKLYMLEFVKMSKIKLIHEAYPTDEVWHRASTLWTVDNDTDIEDAYMSFYAKDTNYGTATALSMDNNRYGALIRLLNVSDSVGAGQVIDSAFLSVHINVAGSNTISTYRVFKPWPVGTVTWNDWDGPDLEWGTANCASTNDAGVENSTDGGGDDRTATAESSTAIMGIGRVQWTLTSIVQGWYDGSISEYGIYMDGSGPADVACYSRQYVVAANRPFFLVYYSATGGAAAPLIRRRRINQ